MTPAAPDSECHARWQHARWTSLRRDVAADVQRYLTKSPENIALGSGRKRQLSALLTPELQCLLLHRLAHWLHAAGWPRLGLAVACGNAVLYKVKLSPQSCIGPGCRLSHPPGVTFHGRAGSGLTLFSCAVVCASNGAADGKLEPAPRLGDGVTLGAHSAVMGPVSVGDACQIAYLTLVTADLAPGSTVIGYRPPGVRPQSVRPSEPGPPC